ncbi:GNAT family N-acetyltransferase [Flammeovirga sp. EKP202]|uniref:GNAT family N-acetyltransferase n=1 Tax=Flammeovirga sp. EKP202 TaxID=2770592 RepID=UPI00165F62BC|nr:GNAT family N-acetyltransferase [Flammeovirga sp. EKP202]MBD0400909.1 GNAT family N-acetyltransferase [Flammeovirga sp. EKP202]
MVKLIDGSQIFGTLWEIYLEAFSPAERRSRKDLIDTMELKNYFFNGIKFKGNNCGLVGFWVFDEFIYIEYLAMKSSTRGSGAGSKFLEHFKNIFGKRKIILEVEHPVTNMQIRRVNFYKRNGFFYNKGSFIQPKYNEEIKEDVELNIMSYPKKLEKEELAKVKEILFERVY